MDGTASVASVVSLDESEPHFYKISPDEMNKLKHSLTLMEDRMRSLWILMGCAHIDPILNELSTVNVTLAKAEKVPEDLTPDPSESENYEVELDAPEPKPEPQHITPGTDKFLIRAGIVVLVSNTVDDLKDLKSAKATKVSKHIEEMEDETLEELCSIILEAADRDSEFIQEFKANAQELMIDFCIKKFQQSLFEGITEMFKQI
ncbi:hypothetical protein D6C76_10666 [Aureobasidium pullulans]|nr:hypothetical protein D6C76_10666 [Aureobasidium pullulans]